MARYLARFLVSIQSDIQFSILFSITFDNIYPPFLFARTGGPVQQCQTDPGEPIRHAGGRRRVWLPYTFVKSLNQALDT